MYKKGILLTLSLVTLASILFSTAFLISYHENEAEQGVTELIILDNLYLKHISLSNSIQRIFGLQNSSISYDNNYIIINISNDHISEFEADLQEFVGFVQTIDSSTDFSDFSDLNLTVAPINITYSHPYSSDKVIINLNSNSLGMNISMNIDDGNSMENVTGNWNWVTSTEGDFVFRAHIKGFDGEDTRTTNIDITQYNELQIPTTLGSVVIDINNSKVEISNGAVQGSIETKILLNSTKDTSIMMPYAYTISYSDSELTGDVRLETID